MRRLFSCVLIFLFAFIGCRGYARTVRVNGKTPLKEQLSVAGAVFLVSDVIDMKGEEITIPFRSTIKFKRRGALVNGTIVGNSTHIAGHPSFRAVRLKGVFINVNFNASWCSMQSMSDYIEDVMNLSRSTVLIVDNDIVLNDSRRNVCHLSLKGKGKTITNSDRFYITYGGTNISNVRFRWDKKPVTEPKDNYGAVVIYHDLLQKDTTITVSIKNVEADGGRYCSYFMKQYKSSIQPHLRTVNIVENSTFNNFTRGAIWACGGTGRVIDCKFQDIGYETSISLWGVSPLRLGYSDKVGSKGKACGYEVRGCIFNNMVAAYNPENDGRELHGLLAYGDSIVVSNNRFQTLSTSFSEPTDSGMDSEMLYIKGSNNTISNNSFENGAGSLSDGIVTLKIKETEGNVIKNNTFLQTSNNCTFIHLGGNNHVVANNDIRNEFYVEGNSPRYAIYIAYQQDKNGSRIEILNNTLLFVPESNYMAIYANGIGALKIQGNYFFNARKLIKNNKRKGVCEISDNTIDVNGQRSDISDSYIELSGGEEFDAIIDGNTIVFSDSRMGRLVTGSNYHFENNIVEIRNSSFDSYLRGRATPISVKDNLFSFDNDVILNNVEIVGENDFSHIHMNGNRIYKKD